MTENEPTTLDSSRTVNRNVLLEREIAGRFEEIADNGWFTEDLPAASPQLDTVRRVMWPGSAGSNLLRSSPVSARYAKPWAERRGKWIYSTDFPFPER